jgi:folate-dependent phosphoribosylglycinamide formyltransferase PurN
MQREKIETVIITGGEVSHRYFSCSIADNYKVKKIYKIHSGLPDIEYAMKQFVDYQERDKEILAREVSLRRKYQRELLLPKGEDYPLTEISHFKKGGMINEKKTISEIQEIRPSHILLYGAPLLSNEFLKYINCPIINLHMGISTKYRGGRGNYWAFFNNDYNNVGYTLHHVTDRIDMGRIIHVGRYKNYAKEDNPQRITIILLQDAVSKLIELIPFIHKREESYDSTNFPRNTSNKEFTLEHLRKVYSGFNALKHI